VKALIIGVVIIAVLGLLTGREFMAVKQDLTAQKEEIGRAWSDLDDNMSRRTELIPSLAEMVRNYAKIGPGATGPLTSSHSAMLNAQTRKQKIDAYFQINSALEKVLVTIENHPNLKATEKFKSLGYRFKETENAVLEARQRYNEAIKKYNTTLSLFPNNVVARVSGFTRDDAYFKTDVNARTAPF
jgi:LemA protein